MPFKQSWGPFIQNTFNDAFLDKAGYNTMAFTSVRFFNKI